MNVSTSRTEPIDRPPRIALVVVDDGLYTHRWVIPILEAAHLEVVCVATLSPFQAVDFNPGGARGWCLATLARMRYYGLAATWRFGCKWARGRADDLLFRMRLRRRAHSVASVAHTLGIERIKPPSGDINHPAFCAQLAASGPDLVVCAFSQRAGGSFVQTARAGCLNVHFSLLPEHRGREPSFRAMLSGKGAGVSVHWMAPELDAGAVVLQRSLDVTGCITLHKAILRACDVAARLVPDAIRRAARWQGAKHEPGPRLPAGGWPSRQETTLFRQKGFRFV